MAEQPSFSPQHFSPVKFWAQHVLPIVYDDSLSYYEILTKLVNTLNGFVDNINTTNDTMKTVVDFVNQFYTDITAQQNAFENKINSDFSTLSQQLNADIEAWEQENAQKLQAQYDTFLHNYQRQFGVVQSEGDSVTDVMSQFISSIYFYRTLALYISTYTPEFVPNESVTLRDGYFVHPFIHLYGGAGLRISPVTIDISGYSHNACVLVIDFSDYNNENNVTYRAIQWSTELPNKCIPFGAVYSSELWINGIGMVSNATQTLGNSESKFISQKASSQYIKHTQVSYLCATPPLFVPRESLTIYPGFLVSAASGHGYGMNSSVTIDLTGKKYEAGIITCLVKNDGHITIDDTTINWNDPLPNDRGVLGLFWGDYCWINGMGNIGKSANSANSVGDSPFKFIQQDALSKYIYNGLAMYMSTNKPVFKKNESVTITGGYFVHPIYHIGLYTDSAVIDIKDFKYQAGVLYADYSTLETEEHTVTYKANTWNDSLPPKAIPFGCFYQNNLWINGMGIFHDKDNTGVSCFGDSITAGTGATTLYHMILADELNIHCYNWGVGGSGYVVNTINAGAYVGNGNEGRGDLYSAEQMTGNNNVLAIMKTTDFNKCSIFAGTNDWAASTPIETFKSVVEETLDYALSKTSRVCVLLPIARGTQNSLNLTIADYNKVIADACDARCIPYVNGLDLPLNPNVSTNRTAFFADAIHPNNAGQQRLALGYKKVFEYLLT